MSVGIWGDFLCFCPNLVPSLPVTLPLTLQPRPIPEPSSPLPAGRPGERHRALHPRARGHRQGPADGPGEGQDPGQDPGLGHGHGHPALPGPGHAGRARAQGEHAAARLGRLRPLRGTAPQVWPWALSSLFPEFAQLCQQDFASGFFLCGSSPLQTSG